MKNSKKFLGFTLAEVLITLGIIGVVAAMTIPSLSYNIRKQQFAASTKKFYSDISNAVGKYMTDNNSDDLSESDLFAGNDAGSDSAQTEVEDFAKKYLKVTKVCEKDSSSDCFASSYMNLNGTNITTNLGLGSGKSFVLPYGAAFEIVHGSSTNNYLSVVVDVNGKRPPNTAGYDLWSMQIASDGSVTDKGNRSEIEDCAGENPKKDCSELDVCKLGNKAQGCFAHFRDKDFRFDY